MKAYVLADIDIKDPVAYRDYVAAVPATIAAYGGKFIVRGGQTESLEGDWSPRRFVIIEFESLEQAKAWWDSMEYAGPKQMRRAASEGKLLLVQGI
jgi:uncharacterized protein (DUF1330 family)